MRTWLISLSIGGLAAWIALEYAVSAVLLALPVLLWAAIGELRLLKMGGVMAGWGAGMLLTAIAQGLSCSSGQDSFAACLRDDGGLLMTIAIFGAALLVSGLVVTVRVAPAAGRARSSAPR
jgi:hypothetical protein